MANNIPEERIRAWMTVSGAVSETTARGIAAINDGELYLIVRADQTINGDEGGLVIPIDARKTTGADPDQYLQEAINKVVELLKEELGPRPQITVTKATNHHPAPPHNATGYITEAELKRGEEHAKITIHPGRQDNSPGFNPWG